MPRDANKYPLHVRAALLESDRLLELARKRAQEAGFDPSEIRSADARRSKPATREQLEDAEDSYLRTPEDDDLDDDDDDDQDEPEKERLDEADEADEAEESDDSMDEEPETDNREKRLPQPKYEKRRKEESGADHDGVSVIRRGGQQRARREAKLRHLAQVHSRRTGLSYVESYQHVMLHEGRHIAEALVLSTPT